MEREVLESIGGRFAGNKRTMQRDMESEIHEVERVSYCAVLRAFKAQSDALTWEKESLITELRKELRISDDEHRQLLTEVNADDLIRTIREWREGRGHRNVATNVLRHANNQVTGPTVSAARKRPRSSISGNPLGGTPSQSFSRQGPTSGTGRRRTNTGQPTFTLAKHMQYQLTDNVSFGAPTDDPPESIVGRRVMIRWPSSNKFYEAVIAEYDPVDGRHSLVYDSNTQNATMEWVNINEVPHEDIRWASEDSIPFQLVEDCVPNLGRGRALSTKNQFANEIQPSSGNDVKKDSGVIEIFHTGSLIKKVEKLLDASHPDELRFKKAKKLLKDHEHSLIRVIAKLAEACDSDGEHSFAQGLSSGRQRRVDYHELGIADRSDGYELARG
ncbi:hypothetical protein PHJA_002688100 [Phtheirospermum japonicum]|uniref:ENT domain-containing protein n=1 Tax=Phtheirospermum japonicum TaxID=374723 RepID=A0A830D2H1_9LAMI|nr:hypothetical protein PHJA_002688100 [Phtheirospermum japonicum]